MSLPQAAPGGGSRPRRTHWTHTAPDAGKNFHAWIAGKAFWFWGHWVQLYKSGSTKPCLHEMTNGELICSHCGEAKLPELVGYQPLYRELDAKPVFVVVHDYSREQVDSLKLHQRVLVGRGDNKHDPVYVIPALKATPTYTSSLRERMQPADLTESLLKLWKLPELTAWYYATHGGKAPPDAPPSPPAPPKKRGGEKGPVPFPAGELAEVMDVAAQRAIDRAERERKTAEWLRQQDATSNGKHEKK